MRRGQRFKLLSARFEPLPQAGNVQISLCHNLPIVA